MKVKILGTGSIYSKRNCSSLIIDEKILFDIGPGTVKQILKENMDLKNINTLLISHLHSDHILDFPTLIVNLEVIGLKNKIKIVGPINVKEKLLKLLKLVYGNYFNNFIEDNFEFIEITEKQKILDLSGYKVEIVEVLHTGIESYGFIVNNKLGMTGDSSLCDGINYIFNNSKIIFADCSLSKGDNYHMGIDNLKELLNQYTNKEIIITHIRDDVCSNLKQDGLSIVDDGFLIEI